MARCKPPIEPCACCGYAPLHRGERVSDIDDATCPRCLAEYAMNEEGTIRYRYDLPDTPLPREHWILREHYPEAEEGCVLFAGRTDDSGRTYCRTCRQYVPFRQWRDGGLEPRSRHACPRDPPA